jgi:hypothetical protein
MCVQQARAAGQDDLRANTGFARLREDHGYV